MFIRLILAIMTISLFSVGTFAQASDQNQQTQMQPRPPKHSLLLAQSEGGESSSSEAFDPFADYNEFDADSDEEADINFFRHGRFLTVGLMGGYRGFTDSMAKTYTGSTAYGIALSYFFDMHLAMSLGFMMGDHSVTLKTNQNTYTGNLSITSINFDLKYYISTQNLTKGLADLGPYVFGGFGNFYRTFTLAGISSLSRDATMGAEVGAGLEIPIMRKKSFLGIQGTYHAITFPDENKKYIDTEVLETVPAGDFYDVVIILGMNF